MREPGTDMSYNLVTNITPVHPSINGACVQVSKRTAFPPLDLGGQ